jgi:hypothetical protein
MPIAVRDECLAAALIFASIGIAAAKPFDCEAVIPRSDLYDAGKYVAAFRELVPLADARCAEAEHLVGVMYAQGRGVQQDFVKAYALLLVAYRDGMTPIPKESAVPVFMEDGYELEVIQVGAKLTAEQLDLAEQSAKKIAQERGRLATADTADPSQVANAARELRPRITGYKLRGQNATVAIPPESEAPEVAGMRQLMHGNVPAVVLPNDPDIRALSSNFPAALLELANRERDIKFALKGELSDQDAADAWSKQVKAAPLFLLKEGTQIRVDNFDINGTFVSSIRSVKGSWSADELKDSSERMGGEPANTRAPLLLVDSYYLHFDSPEYQLLYLQVVLPSPTRRCRS